MKFLASKTGLDHSPSSFHTDSSKAIPLLQFFVRASLVLYVTFVLSLFVSYLTFFWCPGKVNVNVIFPGYLHLYFIDHKLSLVHHRLSLHTSCWHLVFRSALCVHIVFSFFFFFFFLH